MQQKRDGLSLTEGRVYCICCLYRYIRTTSHPTITSIDYKNDKAVIQGIECLLKLQGRQEKAKFGGATKLDTSQIFETPTIEVAALYYISYLFFQKWDHAGAVALTNINTGEIVKDEKTISEVFSYYKTWFKRVKKIGLAKARINNDAPLKGKNITWY